ncbi:MAG TPA: AsmA family protein [Steroidobacteraceae bacterium]|nr:AsmA family protein [Steroidobacteraceae bacterium]
MAVLKWIGISVGILVVVLVLVLLFFDWNAFRGPLAHLIATRLDRPVTIAKLHVVLLSTQPYAELDGIKVGNPAWAGGGQMASIERLRLDFAWAPLLKAEIVLPRVIITKPDLYLFSDAQGRANWLFGTAVPPPRRSTSENTPVARKNNQPTRLPLVHALYIDSGRLRIVDQQRKLVLNGTVETQQPGIKAGQPFRLKGTGELNEKPFDLEVAGGPLMWAESHKPYPFNVEVKADGTRASARGVVPRPFDLGELDVTLSLAGNDLGDLYYLTGLALPNTPPYQLSGHLQRHGTQFEFRDVAARMGKSDLSGTIGIHMPAVGRPVVNADLLAHVLDLKDVAPAFGATKAHEQQSPLLLPTATLQFNRIRAMDATVHFRAAQIAAGKLPLKKVDARVKLDHGLLDVAPFAVTFPFGQLGGTARLDATAAVARTAIDVRLSKVQLSQFLPAKGQSPPIEGALLGRMQLAGTGDSVHDVASSADGTVTFVIPNGEVRQAFVELTGIDIAKGLGLLLTNKQKQTPINCGVADFAARDGVATVQALVIDTGDVVITGSGNINLRNEHIDLSIHGDPKKLRFFQLKTPILVGGTMRHPKVGIKPGNAVGQAAVATVLGALATPFAAVAAFVDPGLNKNVNCSALLRGAKQRGAPLKTASSADQSNSDRSKSDRTSASGRLK